MVPNGLRITLYVLSVALVVFMGLNLCALMKKEHDGKPGSEKIVEAKLSALDEADIEKGGKTDVPSFVRTKYPNPFSNIYQVAFWLPVAASTRIDLCKDDGTVVLVAIDKHLQKGAYDVTFSNLSFLDAGRYVFTLIVDNEIVGTKKQLFIK